MVRLNRLFWLFRVEMPDQTVKQTDLQVKSLMVRKTELRGLNLRYQAIEVSNYLWPPGGNWWKIILGKLLHCEDVRRNTRAIRELA